MVKIINPMYGTDPVAGAFAGIGKSLFGGGDTSDAIRREQLRKLQRENVETEALMRLTLDKSGVQNLGSDPMMQALAIASGYDPNAIGRLGAIGAATSGGIEDPNTSEWLVGMGEGASSPWNLNANRDQQQGQYDTTLAAEQQQEALRLAETIRNNNMTDQTSRFNTAATVTGAMDRQNADPMGVLVNGVPDFLPKGEVVSAPGASPILSATEFEATTRAPYVDDPEGLAGLSDDSMLLMGLDRDAAGNAGTLRNWVTPSGIFQVTDESFAQGKDAQGNPLPPRSSQDYIGSVQATEGKGLVTNAVATDLQSDVIAKQKFDALVGMALPLTEDPQLFGPVGMLRSGAQNLLQTVGGVAQAIGESEADMRAKGLEPLAPDVLRSLIPELYDPRLSEVETLWGLLVYQGAMALAGQQGRSVSDADVLQMKQILGNPQGMFASNLAMRTKLQIAQRVVNAYDEVTRGALESGVMPDAPTGDIPTFNTPEEALNSGLPSGTVFQTPDGRKKKIP